MIRSLLLGLSLVGVLALSIAACGDDDSSKPGTTTSGPSVQASPGQQSTADVKEATLEMKERNKSGMSGKGVLTAQGSQTRVEVTVKLPDASKEYKAAIFTGNCDKLADTAAFAAGTLSSFGTSNVLMDAPLSQLADGQHALVVQQGSNVQACGEIKTGIG